jgi:hypothetical protein
MKKHFVIKTLDYVGLGDQLGTQFAKLYKIGEALDLKYYHTNYNFERSCSSNYNIIINKSFIKIQFAILSTGNRNNLKIKLMSFIDFIRKLLLMLDNKSRLNLRLLTFLGLESYKIPESNLVEIKLYEIIKKSESFFDLIDRIKAEHNFSIPASYILKWEPEYYEISSILDKLLYKEKNIPKNDFLKEGFLKANKLTSEDLNANDVVVHQRCGDSVSIKSKLGHLLIHGNNVIYSKDGQNVSIAEDGNRRNIPLEKYISEVEKLRIKRPEFNIVFISDGFERSKRLIVKYLIDNYLTLSKEDYADVLETAQLDLDQVLIKEPFGKMVNKMVIGEGIKELEESIIALSKAQILIFGTGGFSFFVHSLFKISESTKIYHIGDLNDEF